MDSPIIGFDSPNNKGAMPLGVDRGQRARFHSQGRINHSADKRSRPREAHGLSLPRGRF